MSRVRQAAFAAAFSLALAWAAQAAGADRTDVRGPLLGYVFDPAVSRLRPVQGLPGAAWQGEPLDAGIQIRNAAVSPGQDSALVFSDDSPGAAVLELAPGAPRRHELAGVSPDLRTASYSPNGRAVAVWSEGASHVQVFVGLPASPGLASDLDLSFLPGPVSWVAIGDAGAVVAGISAAGRATLYRLDGGMAATPVWTGSSIAALSFVPGEDALLIADRSAREVYLVRSVTSAPEPLRVANSPDGIADPVAVAAAGGKFFVADSGGGIVSVDAGGGIPVALSCQCRPAALARMAGQGVFRLTAPDAPTMWLLDADTTPARLVFVPRAASPIPRVPEPGDQGGRQR